NHKEQSYPKLLAHHGALRMGKFLPVCDRVDNLGKISARPATRCGPSQRGPVSSLPDLRSPAVRSIAAPRERLATYLCRAAASHVRSFLTHSSPEKSAVELFGRDEVAAFHDLAAAFNALLTVGPSKILSAFILARSWSYMHRKSQSRCH